MAVRSTNTYQEGLQSLIQDVAAMQLVPDANIEFLMGMQQALIEEAQAPLRAQAEATLRNAPGTAMPIPAAAGNAGAAGGPVPPTGPPPGLAALLGAGGPGQGSAPLPPSGMADELRRMMA